MKKIYVAMGTDYEKLSANNVIKAISKNYMGKQ